MTRTEFINEVQDWRGLQNFCGDEGCHICDDVYSDEAKDDYIDDYLTDMARRADGWKDLYNILEDIPTGYYYYLLDEFEEFRGLDTSDFEIFKDDALEWGDINGIWDNEEEEDYEEQADEEPAPPEVAAEDEENDGFEAEGCSIGDLFAASASCLREIEISEQKAKEQEDSTFEIFIAG